MGFKKFVDIFETGESLLSLEHFLDGFKLIEEILAAEFYLFPGAAGAGHVTIEGHAGLSGRGKTAIGRIVQNASMTA